MIFHACIWGIEVRFLKFWRLVYWQMNTGQFKYWLKSLSRLVMAEPFQWFAVHKKIHHGLHGCIYMVNILQIITTTNIHTYGRTIIYSMIGRTSNYKHITLVLAINLFKLSGWASLQTLLQLCMTMMWIPLQQVV